MSGGKSRLIAGLALAVLGACGRLPAYESTALELAAAERVTPGLELVKAWKPLGRSFSDVLSGEDEVRGRFWLASCISELTARYTPPPRTAVRALQLTECMQARGWRLAICDAGVDRCGAHGMEAAAASAGYSKKFAISGR